MEECIENTTKNVYKAEEVERGKIENSQRPVKSGPLLPLLTCGTSCPLPRGKRHQRLHALAPASRSTWASNAAMIRWSEIWENRELKRVGRPVWPNIYEDHADHFSWYCRASDLGTLTAFSTCSSMILAGYPLFKRWCLSWVTLVDRVSRNIYAWVWRPDYMEGCAWYLWLHCIFLIHPLVPLLNSWRRFFCLYQQYLVMVLLGFD